MGLFMADAVIRESISLGLDDLRKNLWLFDYMMSDFTQNKYLKEAYGQKQINAAKEWFRDNNIDVQLGYRTDKMRTPCVSIILGSQQEKMDMKHMGDSSTETIKLMPNQIGKPIPYIIKPFVPVGYNKVTGLLSVPSTVDLQIVSPGMVLVNPDTAKGFVIQSVNGQGILIEPDLDPMASQLAVVPQYQFYNARIEHIFMDAQYSIVCTAHGEAQNAIWLHDIVLYTLLRYKESLLEALGLAESVISSGDLSVNSEISTPGGEIGWERPINIHGQIEQTYVKSPKRVIESLNLREKTNEGFIGGLSIISNTDPSIIDKSSQVWYTDTDEELAVEDSDGDTDNG